MHVLYSVFVEDTLRYIIRMFPGFLLAALMFLTLRPWRVRRLAEKGLSGSRLREAALFLFWLFCGGMAVLTLSPFPYLPCRRKGVGGARGVWLRSVIRD